MDSNYTFIIIALLFAITVSLIHRKVSLSAKSIIVSLLNVLGLVYFSHAYEKPLPFIFYFLVVTGHYYYTHSNLTQVKKYFSPVFYPILFIFLIKYIGPMDVLRGNYSGFSVFFVGISYVSFKMSFYAHQYRIKSVKAITLYEYLSYIFYLPTLMVGPITNPTVFFNSWRSEAVKNIDYLYVIERLLLGLAKFTILSQFFNQATFVEMTSNFQEYGLAHVLIAGFSYYLFLYFNFSGFCDIVVGLGHLSRVDLEENFNRPIWSRNIQEFWKKWHITLSSYMNLVVFAPLNIYFMRRVDSKYANATTVISISATFVLIGYWHGKEAQYIIFGCLQAVAVSINFLWGQFLKKRLGSKGFKRYMGNKYIYCVSLILSLIYMSFCFVVFANDLEKLKYILERVL
jgi:D-alanyl-lipoteichoic acid acyltransferase DltB (MBOAT superfamily)